MSPREARTCTVIGCERSHHGKGYCRIHYGEYIQKPQKAHRSASQASQPPVVPDEKDAL